MKNSKYNVKKKKKIQVKIQVLTALSSFVSPVITVNVAIACAADWHTLLVALADTTKPPMLRQATMIHVCIRAYTQTKKKKKLYCRTRYLS